jgi:hypothetical protein
VDYEPSVKEFVVRDRTTGRMIVPKKDANGDFMDVYGLVTVLSTRDSDRGRLGMVVFSVSLPPERTAPPSFSHPLVRCATCAAFWQKKAFADFLRPTRLS